MKRSAGTATTCMVGCAAAVMGTGGCNIVDSSANKILMSKLGHTSFTVFPAYVRQGRENHHDATSAETLAEFIRDEGLGSAIASKAQVPIAGPRHMSQPRTMRESATSFAAYLDQHPVETDYALLPEYLGGRHGMGGIYAYVLDADGRVAYIVLLNSHWDVFRYAMPETAADCTEVLKTVLRYDLRPANERD